MRALGELARVLCLLSWVSACASAGDRPKVSQQPGADSSNCPATGQASLPLPGTSEQERTLQYWLTRFPEQELDQPLLDEAAVAAYNADGPALRGGPPLGGDLRITPAPSVLRKGVAERLGFMREELAAGRLQTAPGQPPLPLEHMEFDPTAPSEVQLQVALKPTSLRCAPYPYALHKSADDDFDRNACSMIRPQELVQRLGKTPSGMWLARTRYALGFIVDDAPLSPALPEALLPAYAVGAHAVSSAATKLQASKGETVELPAHARLPLAPRDRLYVATAGGVQTAQRPPEWQLDSRPLTRRSLLTEAFTFMDQAYGWGGQDGGRDCARTLMDLFAKFGLELPRHSAWQAKAGTSSEAVPESLSAEDRVARFEAANRRGAVLLSFPGHIMLYLGLGEHGQPMALHSLGEYVRPCEEGGETVLNVRHVVVSDLELGRGSSRRSLLERVDRITVLGDAALSTQERMLPKGRACRNGGAAQIVFTPSSPEVGAEMRSIAVSAKDTRNAELTLFSPEGEAVAKTRLARFGGPPFAQVLGYQALKPGNYTAVLRRGDDAPLACAHIRIRPQQRRGRQRTRRVAQRTPESAGQVWTPRREWTPHMESLWGVFVESLFDYPAADETTWDNLHSLLRDRTRNLLHNHLGLDEDERMELHPDCADLPYMLRAYFAWKLELPFAYRVCNRGRKGSPPSCGSPISSMENAADADPVRAFDRFTSRGVRSGVHSASGRTAPRDSETDLYPVALTRRALQPGTVYADPYGHVMILSKWYEQGSPQAGDYGILMASEAQPDGTIGRKRFWEGSFLFEPDTSHVGAGFKHFRPLRYSEGSLVPLDNAALQRNPMGANISLQQYGVSKEGFYEHMDGLINPKPLKPALRLNALIDALEESVKRRIESVDNAIMFFRDGGRWPVPMPTGAGLFQTTGPWEDFSTPSRDMRLLISIDTVIRFHERVAANPQRYAQSGATPDPKALERLMTQELRKRTFAYQRSNGASQTLTLWDVVQRRKAFEMAYNPNDCIEVRWGAVPGSEEWASCKTRAPQEQLGRMGRYRVWFAERRRPQPGEG